MKEAISTITTKGQITIPIEIPHALNIRPHNKVVLRLENHRVSLACSESVGERTTGALKTTIPLLN